MSSAAQIEANRANAQFSTGPRTTEGKSASASNSTKLGLYAKQAVLLNETDQAEYAALESAYAYELRPYTPVEQTLFSQVVLAAWNIQRANRLEANLALTLGVDPLLSDDLSFKRIANARNRAERNFHKCLKELRASQVARPNPPATPQHKPYTRTESKIGRNEPCPCQSGRKYKHCCLENEPTPSAMANDDNEGND